MSKILLVEDNEMNRDMLSRRLERKGYTVALAEDGRQALEMIEAQKFDLVLLDIGPCPRPDPVVPQTGDGGDPEACRATGAS